MPRRATATPRARLADAVASYQNISAELSRVEEEQGLLVAAELQADQNDAAREVAELAAELLRAPASPPSAELPEGPLVLELSAHSPEDGPPGAYSAELSTEAGITLAIGASDNLREACELAIADAIPEA